jgi:hypothetical protein
MGDGKKQRAGGRERRSVTARGKTTSLGRWKKGDKRRRSEVKDAFTKIFFVVLCVPASLREKCFYKIDRIPQLKALYELKRTQGTFRF